MKIEIEIPDELLARAENVAGTRRTSLSALIEAGLRQVLAASGSDFRLQKHTFAGDGLHADLAGADWEEIRALAYDDRGG